MKPLTTWLNEAEYKLFKTHAERRRMTPYALHKRIVKQYLKDGSEKDLIVVRDRKAILASYVLFVYSLITTVVLVF